MACTQSKTVETVYKILIGAVTASKHNAATYCFLYINPGLAQELLIFSAHKKGFCDAGQFRNLNTDIEARSNGLLRRRRINKKKSRTKNNNHHSPSAAAETKFATTTITRTPRLPSGVFFGLNLSAEGVPAASTCEHHTV